MSDPPSTPATADDNLRTAERITDQLETSDTDKRSYRVIMLKNKLEALLIHDGETDMAGAAMDVNVGSFSDPQDMPGLAHGVEHMVLKGSKKYPLQNEYKKYLADYSGYNNATTSDTSTNFYFELAATPANENGAKISSTGNLETLKYAPERKGINIRQAFVNFHDEYYSADRMKLVVLGRESLDTLEEWVLHYFSGVRNKNLASNRWEGEKPFGENELRTQIFAKPVLNTRSLTLYFPFLNEESLYESHPGKYISHLIGHGGPGSILSHIRLKGWSKVNGISAKAISICPGTSGIFECLVGLENEGLKQYQEIVKTFFSYISLLRMKSKSIWQASTSNSRRREILYGAQCGF